MSDRALFMTKRVYEQGRDTRLLFSIEFTGDGYFAVRHTNPRFCVFGGTITEAAQAAERALKFHRDRQNNP